MNKPIFCITVLLLALLAAGHPCEAAKLKTYVARFSVSAPDNREELKGALQTLLMSRLNNEAIQAVETQADAEVVVVGSYIVFGTVFSLDALVKTSSGGFIDRVFVQGDAQNELIPSITDMARRIHRSLSQWNPALTIAPLPAAAPAPATDRAALAAAPPAPRPVAPLKAADLPTPATQPSAIRTPDNASPSAPKTSPPAVAQTSPPPLLSEPELPPLAGQAWLSQRLPEAFTGIAAGRTRATGGTELFVTGERYLGFYLKNDKLHFLSEVVFEANEKVIGIDVADLDRDGTPEVYVSILRDGQPASQIFVTDKNVLKKTGETLPYLLRAIALDGKAKKVYAQQLTPAGTFTGEVLELAKSGERFTIAAALHLPPLANLYNFNRFTTAKGEHHFVVAHPDGYLLVYSKELKQLWKSREKFGGKETAACTAVAGTAAAAACSVNPPQRLLVTRSGGIIVTRNAGPVANGNGRSFSKHSVVRLAWNGTALQEQWRSEQSPYYLADFGYEERSKELLLLEVEPKTADAPERGSRVEVKLLP